MNKLAKPLNCQVMSIPGASLRVPPLDEATDTSKLTLEDILELAGGHVTSYGPLNDDGNGGDNWATWGNPEFPEEAGR